MRVLLIVHGLPPSGSGGTETYTANLAQALSRQPHVEVTVLAREGDPLRPELSTRIERRGSVFVHLVNNTFQTCERFEETYRHPALHDAVTPLIDDLAPDVVHVQHLTGLSTGLVDEIASRGIPIVTTLNDYWWICHRGQLMDDAGRHCDGPGHDGCRSCIPAAVLAPAGVWRAGHRLRDLHVPGVQTAVAMAGRGLALSRGANGRQAASRDRSAHMLETLGRMSLCLAPSRTLMQRYQRFGIPAARLQLIDQGIDVSAIESVKRVPRAAPMRLGFVGSLSPSKAPHVLLDAAMMLPRGTVSVDLIGAPAPYHGDLAYADALSARVGMEAIRRVGPVPHERIGERLSDLDVVVVPSIWIENAPFVIREAFAARVPVIASDLGGMAEMVRDGIDGLLFPPGHVTALAAHLEALLNDPARLEALRAGIRHVMTVDEDAAQLAQIYLALVRRPRRTHPRSQGLQSKGITRRVTTWAVVLNHRTPEDTWLAVRSLQTCDDPPDRVLVVDNGPNGESEERLQKALTDVEIIASGSNLGFSGGCNVGIARALESGAARILLLNSDAVLAPTALRLLAGSLDKDPGIGIAGPVILSRAEPDMIASAGMTFIPQTGRMRHRAAGRRLAALGAGPVHRVDAVSGCAMLVRREVFERAGLFDEACFYSFEDLDLCLRAAGHGFATVCVTDARVYHEGGRSIGPRSTRRVYYGVRNHLRVAQRIAPLGGLGRAVRGAAIVGLSTAYVLSSRDVGVAGGLLAISRGVCDHLRGRYGP
jgi:GT2 family glycosyltransferase/glycosyltransferase involved in cell wall biosynthesis